MIYGSRVKQARELAGMTQIELASQIGVNQSAIALIERDRLIPSDDLIKAIAIKTGFLPPFFNEEPIDNFPVGSLYFRSKRAVTAREETKAYEYARLMFEQVKKMAQSVNLPSTRLPKIKKSPSKAAEITRIAFRLSPDTPIKNLTHSAEASGVMILSLPLILLNIDAFSTWADMDSERPIIAISSGKPGDRLRFSVGHEIGHLVMHDTLTGDVKTIEQEANDFAAELLMPSCAMRQEFMKPVTLHTVAKLKVRWGVSMQALIMRARHLSIITDRQAKYLFTQMSAHGWRTREPSNLDVKLETPQVVRKMIETLYDNVGRYAEDMNLRVDRATEFTLYA
jgi:Zn-dependent peptidase ImmA (M78 family)/transcriptional regulator with XRE-family HTH domain